MGSGKGMGNRAHHHHQKEGGGGTRGEEHGEKVPGEQDRGIWGGSPTGHCEGDQQHGGSSVGICPRLAGVGGPAEVEGSANCP